jgi:hypothetical protein
LSYPNFLFNFLDKFFPNLKNRFYYFQATSSTVRTANASSDIRRRCKSTTLKRTTKPKLESFLNVHVSIHDLFYMPIKKKNCSRIKNLNVLSEKLLRELWQAFQKWFFFFPLYIFFLRFLKRVLLMFNQVLEILVYNFDCKFKGSFNFFL